jgi:D-xylulose reductase
MKMGVGFDAVLECTGIESSAPLGLFASGPGGVFVRIGLGHLNKILLLGVMCEKETVLKTAFRYGPRDHTIALDSDKINVQPMISSVVPFEPATEAWEKTRRGEQIKNFIEGVKN